MKVIRHEFPVEWERAELLILADSHEGDAHQDKRRLKQFIEYVQAAPNRLVIVNGDIMNMALFGSASDAYGDKCTPNEAINRTVALLMPIKDRILVLTPGNHERRVGKAAGIHVMERVARELYGADERGQRIVTRRYSEGAYLMFLSFGRNHGRDSRQTVYTVYGKHGSGGGKRVGGKLNRLEDMMQVVDADIYLHSHTHVPAGFRETFTRCDYRNRRVTTVEKLFVNTNAFLLFGGYGEELGFNGPSTRFPKIYLDGRERNAEVLI